MSENITWNTAEQLAAILPIISARHHVRFTRPKVDEGTIHSGTIRYIVQKGSNLLDADVRVTLDSGLEMFIPITDLMSLLGSGCLGIDR